MKLIEDQLERDLEAQRERDVASRKEEAGKLRERVQQLRSESRKVRVSIPTRFLDSLEDYENWLSQV